MFKKAKYFMAVVALVGMALSGCSKTDGSTSTTTSDLNPVPFQPKGTVAGVLRDSVTNDPIANATIYIMDKSAITNSGGSFTIANVSANLAAGGNEPANPGSDAYYVVIDMKAVNDTIASYNAVTTNTTKKAYYPSFAYTSATVKYDSLGDAGVLGAAAGTPATATNHDTPVDGFVASIAPMVGKLDANVKIQVVNKTTFANISGAKVELITKASGSLPDAPTGNTFGATGHIVATGTTTASGIVTFSGVEAKSTFAARATSADGKLSGTTGDAGLNDGTANLGPASIATEADNVTVSYLLGQAKNALMVASVETQAPVILSATPENNSDLTVPTTGGQNVVFTFSKAIKADSYAIATDASKAAVAGLYKDISVTFDGSKAGNIAYTLAWSSDMKTLTVNIPSLSPSSKYTVSLAATTLVDSLSQGVTNKATAGKGVIMFTTSGGATAAAPTVVVVGSSLIDFSSSVNLDWNPASGAKKYNVYRSLVENWGATTTVSPYRLLATVTDSGYGDDFATGNNSIALDTTNGKLSAATNFVEAGHVKLTYSYVVKSVNSDLTEGAASTAVAAADLVGSNIVNAGATFITDIIDGNGTITVFFSEPLDEASAETAANYTLNGISGTAPTVSSAVYNGWDSVNGRSSVTLTLSANLTAANITRSYISTGADGILSTTVIASDGALFPLNSGGLCVSPVGTGDASGTVLASALVGDDVLFKSADAPTAQANSIYAGADGTCNSTAAAGDTQIVAVSSKPGANALGIYAATYNNAAINNAATDFTLQTTTLNGTPPATGTADDLVVRQILVTVNTNVKDVAGNTIKTTTTSATTAGNRVNSDGTFTLP